MDNENMDKNLSRKKGLLVWGIVIVSGFVIYVLTQLPFQMGYFGGYEGIALSIIGILQFILITLLIYAALRYMGLDFKDIGISDRIYPKDVWIGVTFAILRALIEFIWIIPATGGAQRVDVSEIIAMLDGSWINVVYYLPLGILGGGISEEIYNRGFFIGIPARLFNNSKVVVYTVSVISIIFFAAGHLPRNMIETIDILVPTIAYTLMFLYTKRLTASIVAHSLWNTLVVIVIFIMYG